LRGHFALEAPVPGRATRPDTLRRLGIRPAEIEFVQPQRQLRRHDSGCRSMLDDFCSSPSSSNG